jgi:hypothetical protein
MAKLSRQTLLQAVGPTSRDRYSAKEIAILLNLNVNTVKAHLARRGFIPVETGERGLRIYDLTALKRYILWIYLSSSSESPTSYTSNERDEILDSKGIDALWNALTESQESFIHALYA